MFSKTLLRFRSKAIPKLMVPSQLIKTNKFFMNHIKNILDENRKIEVEELYAEPLVELDGRVYKPSYTIEFNREGEVLLYSCDPIKHSTVYFKYPYIFYESLIPACLFMFFLNPFGIPWYWNNMNLFLAGTLWIPRVWYWRSLHYRISKLSLLRGGRVLKVETQSLSGDRFVNWVETMMCHPLTEDFKNFDDRNEADFLKPEGQLKYNLGVQLDHFQEMGVTSQDVVIQFMNEGTVHHPELFEAAVKGYNIDTSDFVINTAHNVRAREGNHNH